MTQQEMWRQFIKAVERKGRVATITEIASELYGGEPDVQLQSAVRIANECKDAGFLLVSLDYQDIQVTTKGSVFIGK